MSPLTGRRALRCHALLVQGSELKKMGDVKEPPEALFEFLRIAVTRLGRASDVSGAERRAADGSVAGLRAVELSAAVGGRVQKGKNEAVRALSSGGDATKEAILLFHTYSCEEQFAAVESALRLTLNSAVGRPLPSHQLHFGRLTSDWF